MAGSILAQGEIANNVAPPAGIAAIYAPAGEILRVQLLVGNIHATAQTVYIYLLKAGGTARFVRKLTLEQWESAELIIGAMGNGDEIQAVTNTDDAAYYTISGVAA